MWIDNGELVIDVRPPERRNFNQDRPSRKKKAGTAE